MTPAQVDGFILILTMGYIANTIMLALYLRTLKGIRSDIIHAGVDIHQALLEANLYHRLAVTSAPSRADRAPTPAEAVAEEDPVQWLERQREKMKASLRRA